MCAPFSSQVILRQVQRVFGPARRGASEPPSCRWQASGGCCAPNARGIPWGRRQGRCVSGWGASCRIPWEGLRPSHDRGPWGPRLSHMGGCPPAQQPHSQEARLREAPALDVAGLPCQGHRPGPLLSPGGAWCRVRGRPWIVCPPISTEGLDLFLRQSCILILDVFPEAYFS